MSEGSTPSEVSTRVTHHQRRVLRRVGEELAAGSAPFERVLLEGLSRLLGMSLAGLAVLDERVPGRLRILATWRNGEIGAGQAQDPAGSPNAAALAGETCCYPTGVRERFPNAAAEELADYDSYIGMPLFRDRRVIGVLFAMDESPLDDPELAGSLLKIVGQAATAELERTHVTAELREAEERYLVVSENPYDLIAEIDPEGRLTHTNAHLRDTLGTSQESLHGRLLMELVHPEDRETTERLLENARTGAPAHAAHRLRHQSGSYRWVDCTASAYRTAAGETRRVLIARDVTERRAAEEALQEREERLAHSQRMEAIGRLAGGVAHDFNNLLTAITGYCELLLEEIGDQHPARPDGEEILKAAELASGLTGQLLAFSRRQVFLPKVLDMNALVSEVDRMLRRLIGEDIELVTDLAPNLWPIKADPGQIEQMLVNLVVNARDAMPRGGRICLETQNLQLKGEVRDRGVPGGEYVTLRVSDTGAGMDEATLSRIFEPFFTTKGATKGTGLGLSTVYGIVNQSGGHIRAESRPGEGATFTCYLRRADRDPDSREDPAREAERGREADTARECGGDETILLVEDADAVRRLVRRQLALHGYSVLEAQSAEEAWMLCANASRKIDLVLTDVVLPKQDGLELARHAGELRPGTPTIFMSGFSDDALARHGIVADELVLLQKPFAPGLLLRTVRDVLDGRDLRGGASGEHAGEQDPREL